MMVDPILVDDFVTLADWSTFDEQTGEPRLSSRHVKHSGGSLYLPADGGSVRMCRPLDNAAPGELHVGLVWLYADVSSPFARVTMAVASQHTGGSSQTVLPTGANTNLGGWNRLAFTWTQPDWQECWLRISRGAGGSSAQLQSWWSNLRVLPADEDDEL